MDPVTEKVRALVAEHLRVSVDKVVEGANLVEDLGADELDRVELVMAIEDAFDLSIGDRDIDGLATFGDLSALTTRKLKERSA